MDNYLAVLKKYADFSGRASRSEYWMFVLYNFLISIVLGIVDGTLSNNGSAGFLGLVFSFAIMLPTLAVSIRRLHDIGKSGWTLLVSLIPLIGWLWLLLLYIKAGDPVENEYGPVPSSDGGINDPDGGQVNYVPTYEQPKPAPDLTQAVNMPVQQPIAPQAPVVPMQTITGLDETEPTSTNQQ